MNESIYLIDGHAYVFRAYFGVPPRQSPQGEPCQAVCGFLATLARFVREKHPRFAVIAFDGDIRQGWRCRLDPSYKANRERPDSSLLRQFGWCEEGVRALGFPILRERGQEADDLIGSLAAQVSSRGRPVVIVSPDKDFGQLLCPGVVQWDLARRRTIDEAAVRARWGVAPARLPDLFGLLGDPTDNIPGVRGIGPKTGAALLQAYETLDAIPADPRRAKGLSPRRRARVATLLREQGPEALRSRELARIRVELDVDISETGLAWRGVDVTACEDLCGQLGLTRLLGQIRALAVTAAASATTD